MKTVFLPGTAKLVIALGVNCTIGYGTLFYSFSLLSLEIQKHFAWPTEFIYGIYSLGILISGLIAPIIGKTLDHFNTRFPMSLGSLLVAISLYGLSTVQTQAQFIFWLLLIEVLAILVLYESAFVALAHAVGNKARLPITQVTLMAGFASTIFWPLIAWLLTFYDWRMVYVIMGLLHLLVCFPLHWRLLKGVVEPISTSVNYKNSQQQPSIQWRVELFLAISFGCVAFCINGLQIHLFGLMASLSIPEKVAVLAGVLIGPFQVVSRIADMLLNQRINPINMGLCSIAAMLLGILLFIGSQWITPYIILLFAVLFGMGQGLTYIVRGAIPLYLFGDKEYGTITGRLNGVRMIMTAIAPIAFAVLMKHINASQLLMLLGTCMLISMLLLYSINPPKSIANRSH